MPHIGEFVTRKQTGWISATLAGTWANTGGEYAPASYRMDELGNVHLRGSVGGGGVLPALVFTLPAGFRPEYRTALPTESNKAFGVIDVRTDGAVYAYGSATAFSMDGGVFEAYR